jgi:hypothetical protein
VRSPNPATFSSLSGVAARSAGNLWAVGSYSILGSSQVLALHCC